MVVRVNKSVVVAILIATGLDSDTAYSVAVRFLDQREGL